MVREIGTLTTRGSHRSSKQRRAFPLTTLLRRLGPQRVSNPRWTVVAASTVILACALVGALRLVSIADAASLATVGLTLIVVVVAAVTVKYASDAARSGESAAESLQSAANELRELTQREEGVIAALDDLLRQARVTDWMRQLLDEIDVLGRMLANAYEINYMLLEMGALGYGSPGRARFTQLLVGFQSGYCRFPPGTLPDGIRLLAEANHMAPASVSTTDAESELRAEIARRHDELRELAAEEDRSDR